MNLLKKKKLINEDTAILEAISFIEKQKSMNKKNMKKIKKMNFNIDEMKKWDEIYDYIIKVLKSM